MTKTGNSDRRKYMRVPFSSAGEFQEINSLDDLDLLDDLGPIPDGLLATLKEPPITTHIPPLDYRKTIWGETVNISLGGALIRAEHCYTKGIWIHLTCSMREDTFKVWCKIVDCLPSQDGGFDIRLQFINLDDLSKFLIEEYIKDWKSQDSALLSNDLR